MDKISQEIHDMFEENEGYLSDEDMEGLTIENLQERIDHYKELLKQLRNADSTEEEEAPMD